MFLTLQVDETGLIEIGTESYAVVGVYSIINIVVHLGSPFVRLFFAI